MEKLKILVIEDESIVAKDIQKTLIKLGYDVPATAPSAALAYERFNEVQPALVLCDIKLKGDVDGIEIAERMRNQFNTPVIFLTSYVDKVTLDRAKISQPYGYIIKPFNEADLTTAIEMALYKHAKDSEIRENEIRYSNALLSISDAVMITNTDNRITFMNHQLGQLIGVSEKDCINNLLDDIMNINDTGFVKHHFEVLEIFNFRKIPVQVKSTDETHYFNIIVSPVHDETRNFIGRAYLFSTFQNGSENTSGRYAVDNIILHDTFFVKKGSQLVKVPVVNIFWIQAMDNYVIIQTINDQFIVHSTMKEIESKLPVQNFVRVHRSYIINIDKIQMMDLHDIYINDKAIPIGKSYKDAFQSRLNFL